MQFHPFAYTVKLNIEMTMAELIVKVAKARNQANGDHGSPGIIVDIDHESEQSKSKSRVATTALGNRDRWSGYNNNTEARTDGIQLSNMITVRNDQSPSEEDLQGDGNIYRTREVHVEFEKASQKSENSGPSYYDSGMTKRDEEDTIPLKPGQGGATHTRMNSGNR